MTLGTFHPTSDDDAPVALCLRGGRCPIGLIEKWAGGWITLAMYSFLTGEFGFERRSYPEGEVAEVVRAEVLVSEEPRVWSMDALERAQRSWTGGA